MKTASGVYQITNEVNGKRYIGSAVNLRVRKTQHFSKLRKGSHPNPHLRRAAKIHGVDNFSFKVLVDCSPENVIAWEQIAFDALNPEYNMCPTAGNTTGRKFSEESKDKIRQKQLGRKHAPRSAEYRQKISEVHKGKPKPRHVIDALQAGRKKYKITDEHRQKISEDLRQSYVDGRRSREKTKDHCDKIGMFYADLTDDQIREIFKLKQSGISQAEIARRFKKPTSTISQIVNRKRYKWVNTDG